MRKLVSLVLLLILFVQIAGLVFAQNTPGPGDSIPTVPREESENREQEIAEFAAQRAQRLFLWDTTLWIIVVLSLILGFFITKRMIKTNPKITNWIIHIIIALASLTVFLLTLIDGIRCLMSQYCGFPQIYYFIWVVTFLSAILSISIIIGFVKKRVDHNCRINMSSSPILMWIIFIILATVAELIIRPNYDIPAFFILPLFSGVITLALYFILGIVGYFIDRSNSSSA